jgi:hypothetical protein
MVLEEYTLALASSLEKANLVPGSAASLIPQGFKPTTKLNITYGDRPLDLGNLFRVTEVKTAPSVSFPSEVSLMRSGSPWTSTHRYLAAPGVN